MTCAAITPETLPDRLGSVPVLTDRIGAPGGWRVAEVGAGTLNLVFIMTGPVGQIVVKQALPDVRLVKDSWPLPLNRGFFEYSALTRQAARNPYRAWLLDQLAQVWQVFAAEFRPLWRTERTGILYEASRFEAVGDAPGAEMALAGVLGGIWRETMAFCGVEMHRRILGLADVEDLEAIPDPASRVLAEARALEAGRIIASACTLTPEYLAALARDLDRSVAR